MQRGTALIVGGSAGIGLHLARRFAAEGHGVVLVARDAGRLREAARLLTDEFACEVSWLALDCGLEDAASRMQAELTARAIVPRYVVIGLGQWSPDSVMSATDAQERRITRINVESVLALLRTLAPRLPAGGKILVVGSLAGFVPVPGLATYAASKAHLHASVLALRREIAATGVDVSLLAPGVVSTGFVPADATSTWRRWLDLAASRPETVARAGYCGLMCRQAVIVPGLVWRIAYLGIRILPSTFASRITGYALAPLRGASLPRPVAPTREGS